VRLAAVMFFAVAAAALAGCGYYGNDEGVRYLQRKDPSRLVRAMQAGRTLLLRRSIPGRLALAIARFRWKDQEYVRAMECNRQGGQDNGWAACRPTSNANRAPGRHGIPIQETHANGRPHATKGVI
jgi:hypothetical protein